ncbi:phosphonate ABC transporter ATP-binding protein [Caldimonas aquatica]|uniref:Phosphonate ABC transporter ATP-binding protein n=1 Tax=Caldimonas aquatica TaxID=376175 RepID=A0ABY6MR47_9BURK|nr:phosphonate ABC transporter ATP-binding protein [Schlegelella aquatica]UZD54488.1 phosphonate ABC transporter ATP-binding protein [Schlegelella aquatica]
MHDTVIEVRGLRKTFGDCCALKDVDLTVRRGEMVALLGASGSGKSTLLRHLCGLHRGDEGSESRVAVLGRLVQQAGRLERDVRRTRAAIATIFQQFNLVDRLPVMHNVLAGAFNRLPLWRTALRRFPAHELEAAWLALQRVGIERCAWQRASTLSGGQQQRAAISRAIVQRAQVILADEPIASLDPESSRKVMELLARLNQEQGTTVVVSLHQVDFAFAYCPRTVALRHGQVVYDGPTAQLSRQRLMELYGTQTEELFSHRVGALPGAASQPALAGALPAAA